MIKIILAEVYQATKVMIIFNVSTDFAIKIIAKF